MKVHLVVEDHLAMTTLKDHLVVTALKDHHGLHAPVAEVKEVIDAYMAQSQISSHVANKAPGAK